MRYCYSIDSSRRATVPSLYLQYIGRNVPVSRKGAFGPRVTGRTASLSIPSGAFLWVLQPKAPNASLCMQFLTRRGTVGRDFIRMMYITNEIICKGT